MIKKTILAVLTASTLSTSTLANADNVYAGLNLSVNEYGGNYYTDDARIIAFSGRLGIEFNKLLSGEVRIGTGMADDSFYFGDNRFDIELDSMYGAYLRLGNQINDAFYPYILAGYNKVELTVTGDYGSDSGTENGFSWGLGAEIGTNKNFLVNLEYINHIDKTFLEFSGLSLGFTVKF